MTSEPPAELRALLSLQDGVITRTQALHMGMTGKMIEVKLRSGRWQRLHNGVYATFSGTPPRSALLWGAVLRTGPQSVLSHHTAAELYGLLDASAPMLHVTVPPGSGVARPAGVILHFSGRLERTRHPTLTPPRTRIEETVLDLAGALPTLDDAIALLLRANAGRRTTADRIAAAMRERTRVRWRRELAAALELGREGVHSLLEFRYVNRVERAHRLPAGQRQHPVMRGQRRQYQDVEYEGYGLVVELDGRAAHPEWARWSDIRRDNASAAAGQLTLRYGWADVTQRPCLVAREVGEALRQRGWDGPIRRCGTACPAASAPGRGRLGA